MYFIAKNPLVTPKIQELPPVPPDGTRGLFAKDDGWSDIDSNGNVNKMATEEYVDIAISTVSSSGVGQDVIDVLDEILEIQQEWFTEEIELTTEEAD